jgi:hypothetical protein
MTRCHRSCWLVLAFALSIIAAVSVLRSFSYLPIAAESLSSLLADADLSMRILSTTRLYQPILQRPSCHIPPSVKQVMLVRLCGLVNKVPTKREPMMVSNLCFAISLFLTAAIIVSARQLGQVREGGESARWSL